MHVTYARRVYIPTLHWSKTIKNPLITPHNRYYDNIYVLHIIKVSQH